MVKIFKACIIYFLLKILIKLIALGEYVDLINQGRRQLQRHSLRKLPVTNIPSILWPN